LCTLCNTIAQAQTKTIFLTRHAEKAEDTGDRNPELNEAGLRRAQNLANILSEADIELIYSTDFKRTLGTGLPLAEKLGIEISLYDSRDENFLNKILLESGDKRILIIGHANTIPRMANQLIKKNTHPFLDETEYDKLFMVTMMGDLSDCVVIKY
jgi:broad specificity phosphatase PhoE